MLFKSEKKQILNLVIEALNEAAGNYADNVESLKSEYAGDSLEAKLYFEKKNHLFAVLDKAIEKISKIHPDATDNIYYLTAEPELTGYEIDTENGMLAGDIYAICYTAVTGKKADIGDSADLNAKHAMLIKKVMDM